MNTALATLAALAAFSMSHAPLPQAYAGQVGKAYHYYQGLMKRVAQVRVRQGLISRVRYDLDGWASTQDCANIGRTLAARFADSEAVEQFQIVDCSNPRDLYYQQHTLGLVAEFDYRTAQRHPALMHTGHITVEIVAIK